ncbi:Mitochondrial import inner membrane translocase subunit tim8 [Arachnomyces sp. PD_36]|nr:Mitochondrial import inner membrane translocase subunit tim8 [Arachnomyces sp. PD_36]
MDAAASAGLDPSKLNASDKREVQQALNNEAQKANIQQTVHQLTEVCWKKCVPGKISSASMDRSEEACAQNCVDRWMDTNFAILKQLEQMR